MSSLLDLDLDPATVTDIVDFWLRVVLQKSFDPHTDGIAFVRALVRLP